MADRKYFVLCENGCKFEAMTKEQTIAAIADATGSTPQNVDGAFITMVKEQNTGAALKFWVGTQAQYNALAEKEKNCFYILTDETTGDDLQAVIEDMQKEIETLKAQNIWVESEEWEGCFYRNVEGDDLGLTQEWLNPPLAFITNNPFKIYRTAERRGQAPVYCFAVTETFESPRGSYPIALNGAINWGGSAAEEIKATILVNGQTATMPYISGGTVYTDTLKELKDENDNVYGVKVNFVEQINGTVNIYAIVKFCIY